MKKMIVVGVIVLVLGLVVPETARSQGTLFVSSLGQPSTGSAALGSDSLLATTFLTGNNPDGYALDSLQLDMTPATGDPGGFTVQLYTAGNYNGTVVPVSSLGILTGSSDPVNAGLYTYTASGLTVAPSTLYFVVLSAGTPVASGAYAWSFDNSPAVTSGGWSGSDFLLSSSDGSSWKANFEDAQFSLTATAVPEPEPLYLLGLPGVLFFVWRRWRVKGRAS
jgi:hypothetical protein